MTQKRVRVSTPIRVLLCLIASAPLLALMIVQSANNARQERLKREGALRQALITARDRANASLMHAIERRDIEAVCAALSAGANANADAIEYSLPVSHETQRGLSPQISPAPPIIPPLPTARHTPALLLLFPNDNAPLPDNPALLRLLLEHRASADARDESGRTALMLAASHGWKESVRLLLQYRANVDATDDGFSTPLIVAASRDTNNPLLDRKTAQHDQTEIVRLLLQAGAEARAANINGETALTQAAEQDNTSMALLLLAAGAEVTALAKAARLRDLKTIRFLVAWGANVNQTGGYKDTALYEAVSFSRAVTVRYLLDHGAKVNQPGNPVLLAAVHNGDFNMARLLVSHRADINTRPEDDYDTTPLMRTVEWGEEGFARELLRRGANVNASNREGRTALHIAAEDNNDEMVALLLDRGADVNARDKDGHTPLTAALANKEEDCRDVIALLRAASAKE